MWKAVAGEMGIQLGLSWDLGVAEFSSNWQVGVCYKRARTSLGTLFTSESAGPLVDSMDSQHFPAC